MIELSVEDEDIENLGNRLLHGVFGDRLGLLIFLCSLAFFMLVWRIGIFSTDTYTVANTMASVGDGHLSITTIEYGPDSGVTPGMHVVDHQLYGRNYGEIVLSLPFLYLLQLAAIMVDLRIAIASVWVLLILGIVVLVGDHFDRANQSFLLGSTLALLLFVANVAIAQPIGTRWLPLMALQIGTMVAAGFTAVFLYRLNTQLYGRRVGGIAGFATFLATPVGFWATFPKRHSFTAVFAVLVLFLFYKSRRTESERSETILRALAYATVGGLAWIHSAEGLVLLIALVVVDFPTASFNRPRNITVISGAFLLSLIPFFVTNYLISGQPIQPPRTLQSYIGSEDVLLNADTGSNAGAITGSTEHANGTDTPSTAGPEGTDSTGSEGAGTGSTHQATPPAEPTRKSTPADTSPKSVVSRIGGFSGRLLTGGVETVSGISNALTLLGGSLSRSLDDWTRTNTLYHTIIRSGYIEGLPANDRAINLSILESMPVLGALFSLPFLFRKPTRAFSSLKTLAGISPERATDIFAILFVGIFTTLYLDRFPAQHMLTVRYLHPLYPIGVYGLCRLPPVRTALDVHWTQLARSYGLSIVVISVIYIVGLVLTNAVLSEAVQLYAHLALGVTGLTASWSVLSVRNPSIRPLGTAVLGIAAASMTVYLFLAGFGIFAYTDEFALPLARAVAESLQFINPLKSLW